MGVSSRGRSPLGSGRAGFAIGLVAGAVLGMVFLTRLTAGDRAREINARTLTVIGGTSALVGGTIGGFLGIFVGAILAERRKSTGSPPTE